MMFAKSVIVPAGPTNLEELFEITDFIGARFLILETAGVVNYGDKASQPGLVGARLRLENSNPKDVYVSAANVAMTLIIQ